MYLVLGYFTTVLFLKTIIIPELKNHYKNKKYFFKYFLNFQRYELVFLYYFTLFPFKVPRKE